MNVLLVRHRAGDEDLFLYEAARELRTLGLRSRVVWDLQPLLKHRLWTLGFPTVVVSLCPMKHFFPHWAQIFHPVHYDKIQESRRLEQSGIPVPKWIAIQKGEAPDLSCFSNFVVVKPAYGSRGALVRVMRRDRVQWRELQVQERRSDTNALLAQEYIHTGPWPSSYRVVTVFGEPFYALRITAHRNRLPIEFDPLGDPRMFAGRNIVASSKGCTMDGQVPEDVIELARRMHERAFPNLPLIAADIVRDFHSGRLYALEANTGGLNMLVTPTSGQGIKEQFGIDLCQQFGGVRAFARGVYRRVLEIIGANLTTHENVGLAKEQAFSREEVLV